MQWTVTGVFVNCFCQVSTFSSRSRREALVLGTGEASGQRWKWNCRTTRGTSCGWRREQRKVGLIMVYFWFLKKKRPMGAHRSHEKTVPINKPIFAKLWLYHNVDLKKKKLWELHVSYFCKNWNPLHQRMLCAKFIQTGPVVLEKKIFKFHQFIFYIFFLSPLEKGRGPSFEQTWIPFT